MNSFLLDVYRHQHENGVPDNVYKITQCDFAYNSNHMEGSRLTHEQTVLIYERNSISGRQVPVDDIIEAKNHFDAFDYIIDHSAEPLSHDLFKTLHKILKAGTTQATRNDVYTIGEYKRFENAIGAVAEIQTSSPQDVPSDMETLLKDYDPQSVDFEGILDFHWRFERIHPFSDGNGRVGRLIMFKECLRFGITPFIITDDLRDFYIRGLQNWQSERGWLRDTCLTAQDRFKDRLLPMAERYAETFCTRPSLESEARGCKAASVVLDEGLGRETRHKETER